MVAIMRNLEITSVHQLVKRRIYIISGIYAAGEERTVEVKVKLSAALLRRPMFEKTQ